MFLFIHYRFLLQSSFLPLQNSKDFPWGCMQAVENRSAAENTGLNINNSSWRATASLINLLGQNPSLLPFSQPAGRNRGTTHCELGCFMVVIAKTSRTYCKPGNLLVKIVLLRQKEMPFF